MAATSSASAMPSMMGILMSLSSRSNRPPWASAGLREFGVSQDCKSVRILDTRVTLPPTLLTIGGVAREGVWEDTRFRDEVAKLEVDVVALEMLVLRVLAAEKSGKISLDIAGLLKIRGSELQQRYSELMMLAAGPFALPLIREAMAAGWQGDFPGGEVANAPLASTFFNMRKTTIYGGSNEVQRNIVAQTVLS